MHSSFVEAPIPLRVCVFTHAWQTCTGTLSLELQLPWWTVGLPAACLLFFLIQLQLLLIWVPAVEDGGLCLQHEETLDIVCVSLHQLLQLRR